MNDEFKKICKNCSQLKKLLKEQRKQPLPEERWSVVVRLLIDAGRIALARIFTEQSGERDYEREAYIDQLSIQKPDGNVLCRELGCTDEEIEDAWGENGPCWEKEPLQNEKGEVIYSPINKILLDYEEKWKIGLYYENGKENEKDENESSKTKYKKINPNDYAAFILKNYNFMLHNSNRYYIYNSHCWRVFSDFKMEKVMRYFFHKLEPGEWRRPVQSDYLSTLRLECWDTDDLQPAERYINVKNGLLDLDTEKIELLPHDKRIFSTTQIPIEYDENAQCPGFINFLQVTFGEKNKKLIKLVQEIMGYCLSSSVKAQKMFIFLGSGSNGKSVLCEIMTALAGGIENVSTVALKDLSHRFALSQILDKNLNISTENDTTVRLETQMLKAITSGDPIQMEEKFQAPFSYRPYVKLVFAMNSLPYARDKSFGFERRLVIIPFEKRFVDHEPRNKNEVMMNRNLADTLIKEELQGIFTYAIKGLKRLRRNNFIFTKSSTAEKALEKYKEMINPYLLFVREFVTEEANAESISSTEFKECFVNWCKDEGYIVTKDNKLNPQLFWKGMEPALQAEGIKYKRDKENKGKGHKNYVSGINVVGLNHFVEDANDDDNSDLPDD